MIEPDRGLASESHDSVLIRADGVLEAFQLHPGD
jgi:hypothetical protein